MINREILGYCWNIYKLCCLYFRATYSLWC